jgi:hypothetical protein
MKYTILAVIASLAMSFTALAQSPHFVKGPTPSFDTSTGDFVVNFKEAGLGNLPITYTLSADNETFTFRCFTRKGNTPQGEPNGVSFSNESVSTTIQPRNGQITGSLELQPQLGGASCQGGGLILKLIFASYEGVTFCDSTNNICVDMGNQGGSVVPPLAFGGGHGH